jgi:hypothetical protein
MTFGLVLLEGTCSVLAGHVRDRFGRRGGDPFSPDAASFPADEAARAGRAVAFLKFRI